MTKQEFKDFCNEEFKNRGFRKKKNMYYLSGEGLLCGLNIQKSMGEAFYVNYDFFIGNYQDRDIKDYPTSYESDFGRRFTVLSKDTFKGEHFMDACIEYGRYTIEEIKLYFDATFDKYIMPPIKEGKKYVLEHQEHYFRAVFADELPKLLDKLK